MREYLRYPFREPKQNTFLKELRERLLWLMLLGTCLIGTVLYVIALIPAFQKGLLSTIIIYSILYTCIILITFVPRLPYRVRAICWLGSAYILGSLNLLLSGFNVDSGLFLITFIAMAVLLLGLPGGIVSLLLGSVTIAIMAFINVTGQHELLMGLPQSNPLVWIIGGIIFLMMGMLLIYSLTIVVTGLASKLAKTTRLSEELELTNKSLRLSEVRYRTLVEASPSLVVLLDLNGNIIMFNQVGLALFGYGHLEEIVGKNMLVFIAPEDHSRVAEAFQSTLQGEPPNDIACLGLRKDGTRFFAEFNATLVRDEAGKPQAVIGIGKDITARREAERILREAKEALAEKVVETSVQLEQTSNRLEELVKHGPAVIFSYRVSDRVVTYISENVAALLGYEAYHFIEDSNFWRSHVHPEDMVSVISRVDNASDQGRSAYDYRFLKKDGTYCWLHGERVLLRDTDGNPLEYIGSWVDITELKKKEQALRFFQDRYRSLYESMMDAYVSTDMVGWINQFNYAFLRMLGYAAEELHELTYQDLTPQKWHDSEAGIIKNQVIPRGYSDIYEKEYIRKDGTVFPVELRTVLTRDEAGNPSGMWAIVRDISERKLAEQILRESEERYRELLDHSMQAVIVFQDMRFVYVNQAVTELLGYSETELRSLTLKGIFKLMVVEDRRIFRESVKKRNNGIPNSEGYSLRVIHRNKEIRWVEARNMPIEFQGKAALLITAIDVSEIRRAQTELQENAKTQQTILNAIDALVFLIDLDTVLISTNDKFAERMGMKADTMVGTILSRLFPEDIYRARKVYFDQVINSGNPITFVDENNGTWFDNRFYPIKDVSGKVVRVAIFAQDITERRRMTEALRASEEQYRTLAEAAHDMIFTITRDGRIGYVNSFGANFLGLEPRQLIGQPRERLFRSEINPQQEDHIQNVFKTGQAISSENAIKFSNRTIWFNTWLVPLRGSAGEISSILGVSRDITERRKSLEALQQAREQLEERVAERTKELLASQEKLRLLATQTVNAQEKERRSISRELHDEAGQALITLKYDLASIQNELPETDALLRQRLSESMKIIDQTMLHIRDLAHSLRPPVLEVGGIHLSLQDYCQEISGRTHIPISYQGLDIPGIPDETGISLYRFVQEALTNIMKHAHATKVKVRLHYNKGEISLSVSDNGRGMGEPDRSEGLGLLGIKERLNLLGGKLEIHSQKGRGTKLVAHVPWVSSGIE